MFMPKILKTQVEKDIFFTVDILVESTDYSKMQIAALTQLGQNLQIKGYRKGKAPVEKIVNSVGQEKAQNAILNHVVNTSYENLKSQISDEIKKLERGYLPPKLDLNQSSFNDNKEGFQFRLNFELLPKIDYDTILKNVVKVQDPEKVEGRVSFEEFYKTNQETAFKLENQYETSEEKMKTGFKAKMMVKEWVDGEDVLSKKARELEVLFGANQIDPAFEKEVIGMKPNEEKHFQIDLSNPKQTSKKTQKYNYEVQLIEVKTPKFKTLDEVLKNADKSNLPKTEKEFKTQVKAYYDAESEKIKKNFARKELVAMIAGFPEISLNEALIEESLEKRWKELEPTFPNDNTEFQKRVEQLIPPNYRKKKLTTKDNVKVAIKKMFWDEFKLAKYLEVIFTNKVLKVENGAKKFQTEVERIKNELKKSPERYGIDKNIVDDDVRLENTAADRYIRNTALEWLLSQLKIEVV